VAVLAAAAAEAGNFYNLDYNFLKIKPCMCMVLYLKQFDNEYHQAIAADQFKICSVISEK
jgi:hypothetical protein